jgi:pyridoxine 5-phosphate synthase
MAAGADGITAHLREDRRHINDDDLARSGEQSCRSIWKWPPPRDAGDCPQGRPHACCLVPERREERTTEGGLDAAGQHNRLSRWCSAQDQPASR